ncbi:MAG: hypothetical protein K9K93_00680 [Acholeplasmataceae bacterium]|nr:hypothetical protein [Acholeplasmataceae bacterium]
MIQRFRPWFKVLNPLIHAMILLSFFTKTFNYHMDVISSEGIPMTVRVPVTGFEALISGHFFVFGNILIWGLFLGSLVMLGLGLHDLGFPKRTEMTSGYHIVITNLQIVFAILVATLLGTFLELLGMAVIALVVIAALMRHSVLAQEVDQSPKA